MLKVTLFVHSILVASFAFAGVEDGNAALRRGDYTSALREYSVEAEQGNAAGQFGLGFLYANGQGVPQDDVQAFQWFLKAAEQGHANSQNNVGFMYLNGRGVAQDNVESARWFRKAADQGSVDGQFTLGTMYENGRGVSKDVAQAVYWFRKAADRGNEAAKGHLLVLELKSGTIKPTYIHEAWVKYEKILDLSEVAASPLWTPDNAIYGGRVILDAEVHTGVLRVKWDSDSEGSLLEAPWQTLTRENFEKGMKRLSLFRDKYGNDVFYAQLNLKKDTINFSPKSMRIGGSVWVIGRYVANNKYTTVIKTEKTMPVFEVLYIGE